MPKIATRKLDADRLAQFVQEGEGFATDTMSGQPGRPPLNDEHRLPQGVAANYEAAHPQYTISSYDTPIAWKTGSTWTIPEVQYGRTTAGHTALVRRAIEVGA